MFHIYIFLVVFSLPNISMQIGLVLYFVVITIQRFDIHQSVSLRGRLQYLTNNLWNISVCVCVWGGGGGAAFCKQAVAI